MSDWTAAPSRRANHRMLRMLALVIGVAVGDPLGFSAAQAEIGPAPNLPAEEPETMQAMPGDQPPSPPPAWAAPLVAAARADLSSRLGVGDGAIATVVAEEVTWPDGSIGCPRPGMAYVQRLVDGTRIVLAVAGVRYHYHAAGNRTPAYCPTPAPPVRAAPGRPPSGGTGPTQSRS